MSEMHADLKAAQQRILALKHNILELEEAGKRTAERLIHVERRLSDANGEVLRLGLQLKHHLQLQAERDALAAKLAELEGQEPALYVQSSHVSCAKYSPFLGRICQQPFDGIHQTAYFARPVPAEPVNARLLDAARAVVARWETPLWKDAPATAGFIYELRNAIAAAESAPKAVRLTAPDIVDALRGNGLYEDLRAFQRLFPILEADARAIEIAALRKNGIEVAE